MFRAPNRFQPCVRVEFAQGVLDMIIDGRAADIKLVGNTRGCIAFPQQTKNLKFTISQLRFSGSRTRRGNQCDCFLSRYVGVADDEIANQNLQTLTYVNWADDMDRKGPLESACLNNSLDIELRRHGRFGKRAGSRY